MLEATGRDAIPQSHWEEVKVYIPQSQRVFIKKNGLFADRDRHRRFRVYPEALPGLAERAVMLFRPPAMSDPGVASVLDGAGFTYSMWEGISEGGFFAAGPSLAGAATGIPWQPIHTSGHASTADLQRFAAALAPRALAPIHSFETGRFPELLRQCRPEGGRRVVGSLNARWPPPCSRIRTC